MPELNSTFEDFLSAIEPGDKAVKYAIKAHEPVREHLKSDDSFKENVIDTFLYGSYRRHTAVGDIKDVDIVVLTSFDITNEECSPNNVLKKLKASLSRFYKDPENPEYQRRSIRINEPLPDKDTEMTLDIIPAVPVDKNDGVLWVPDREVKKWVYSHPNGHIKSTTQLNSDEYSQGRLVPLVKIAKWWWKYQCSVRIPKTERPKPKGFWIECLVAENFDPSQKTWAEQFISLFQNVQSKYSSPKSVPELRDPGLTNETIKTNMTLDEFSFFMEVLEDSLNIAQKALAEGDEETSEKLWREVFGDKFGKNKKSFSANETTLIVRDKGEQFLSDFGITENIQYKIKVDARVIQDGWRPFLLRGTSNFLRKKRKLEFFIQDCKVPGNYSIKWKVKNYGDEAIEAEDLRGEITSDRGRGTKIENTKYTGRHYVECYAIQNSVCVAKDRIEVPIANLF
jgi:hypothetical protein